MKKIARTTLALACVWVLAACSETEGPPASPAVRLDFSVQPSEADVGVAINPAVAVRVLDAEGEVVTAGSETVTVALGTNPLEATLGGTLSQTTEEGIAVFNDLTVDTASTGYTLVASCEGLISATSDTFIVTPQDAELLALSALKDNTLYESATGALSNGAGTIIFSGRTNGLTDYRRRAVIAFDVAGELPAGAVIQTAVLKLGFLGGGNDETETVSLHRLTADWGEGTSDAAGSPGQGTDATPGDATWIHRFYDTDFWVSAGGDYAPEESASADVLGDLVYAWHSEGVVADVQDWLDNPGKNFGWILLGNEERPGSVRKFSSRESDDRPPVLEITYEVP